VKRKNLNDTNKTGETTKRLPIYTGELKMGSLDSARFSTVKHEDASFRFWIRVLEIEQFGEEWSSKTYLFLFRDVRFLF